MSLVAVGASIFAYGFVRDRATEFDTVLELPDPPQVGRSIRSSRPARLHRNTYPDPAGAGCQRHARTGTSRDRQRRGHHTRRRIRRAATADPGLWDDPRRVSVLLMGIDQRAGEEGTFPTDTIILFSVDPVGQTAAILSIPRDLWVEYPGLPNKGRINGANILGDEITYPGGGGPAFAVKAVEKSARRADFILRADQLRGV